MRIAFVTLEYPPFIIGGSGVYASRLVAELTGTGNEVVVFTPRISGGAEVERSRLLTIHRIPVIDRLPLKSLHFSLRLPRIFEAEDRGRPFDIVHFNSICYWFIKSRLSRAPHIVTVHHPIKDARTSSNAGIFIRLFRLIDENNIFQELLDRRTVDHADRLIAVSKYTGSRLADLSGVPLEKVVVIHNGVNFKMPETTTIGVDEHNKSSYMKRKKVILFVGRVDDPRKGLDLLLKAFKLVAEKHGSVLIVAGAGDQGEAKRTAERLGINDMVKFAGYVDDEMLKKLYLGCDVHAVPSRLEGFGLTVLEAMAAGKPVVATRVGSIPELMENGVHGALVNPGDARGMARAICAYLGDERLARETGARNKIYVTEKFSWSSTAANTIKAYRQLADERHDDQAEPD